MRSFEVEEIIYQGEGLDGVVVGEILEIKKHPNADKLNLVKVNVGDFGGSTSGVEVKPPKSAILNIVCGAPNVEVGQKVAVALVGAELPGGFKIEKRKVRGVESSGMICAEDELGIGDEHKGIMVLDKNLENGTSIKKALHLDDVIFEIDILPNRAHDCLCHLGVAREVAAITGGSSKYSSSSADKQATSIKQGLKENSLDIKIEDKNLCKRYSAVVVKNIKIKDSPAWLKNKLESCGVRSINNIVDITNYVMLVFGQPMHAFDYDKIKKRYKVQDTIIKKDTRYNNQIKIIVRNAKKGESILALDEEKYKLTENDLVIADEKKAIAIAGVMGGMETAVDEGTKNIIFEAANFDCTNIRKTAQRLKLSSESSYRFEREIDPEMTIQAIMKAVEMVEDLTGGKTEEKIIDIYASPVKKKEIEFNFERIKNLLGVEVAEKEIMRILESLGFEVAVLPRRSLSAEDCDERERNSLQSSAERLQRGGSEEVLKILKVKVPTYRIDIERVNDIIEEISRIYGYKNIPEVAPEVKMESVASDKILLLEKDIRIISEGLGFCEIYNYSFVSEKDIMNIGLKIEDHLELQNPLSEEHKFLRVSVLPYLLKNVEKNLKYKDDFALFELGRVYLKNDNNKLPDEKRIFAGVMSDKNVKDTLFYELKGRIEILLSKLGFGELVYKEIESAESFWHKGRSAEIIYQNKTIGKIGEIHPNVSSAFGIEARVSYFEIYEEEFLEFYSKEKNFRKINKFPTVELDLSVVFDEGVRWDDVKKAIFSVDNKLIKNIQPFDIYRGKTLGNNKKSIAFRIFYQAEDRTLKDEEVGVIQKKVVGELGKMGGEVRK